MRNHVVSAIGSVDMTGFVTATRLGMTVRVAGANGHDALVDTVLVRVMQMPVVQAVGVPVMHDRGAPVLWRGRFRAPYASCPTTPSSR